MSKNNTSPQAMKEFIHLIADQLKEAKKSVGGCYLAIMPMDDNYHDIEVEVSEGTIAGTFACDGDLDKAREVANELAEMITSETSCKVIDNRADWDDLLEGA